MSLGYEDCKVFVSTVDSQSSAEGGIIIQVVGELSNRGGPWRKFAQTFFLAEQPNGYFVLNDIFRYIKEESDEDEAVSEEPAAAPSQAAAATSQQEVTYDQLNNAAIVGGQEQSSSSAAPHQDFELAQQHGAPADAAGVTVAPPTEAHQEDARANLEDLASGQREQQQVVELHEDLTQEQLDSSAAAQSSQVNGDRSLAEETSSSAPAQAETTLSEKEQESSPAAAPEKSESKTPAAQAQAPPAPAKVQEAPKSTAPKTWANLAAAGQTKWKPQVMAATAGVTSSVPTSSAGASRSSTPAGPSDKIDAAKGEQPFQQQQARGPNNKQQQQQQQQNPESRKYTNVETPYSIVLDNITEDISHGMLRSRLSDTFAQHNGSRKESARLSYLDIDRRKSTAYVDFEEEWAYKKAVEKGSVQIDGNEIAITAGKGDRRDATGLGRSNNAGKGRGQGQGPKGGQGGPNTAGPNRGGPRDGQQRSQRGGRGGGKQ